MTEICGWRAFYTARTAKHFRKCVQIVQQLPAQKFKTPSTHSSFPHLKQHSFNRGVARIFQRGCHTVSKWGYSPDCHYGQGIVMAFSPPVVGCLVKKGLQKGGSRAPQDSPWLRPCLICSNILLICSNSFLKFALTMLNLQLLYLICNVF